MKTLLIALFIVLFIYLIIHMCGGPREEHASAGSSKRFVKNMLVLDELMSLNDKDLHRLKDEIQDLKTLIDGGPADKSDLLDKISKGFSVTADRRKTVSGKRILKNIQDKMKKMESKGVTKSRRHFSKFRIILIQIFLIIITMLMVML